MGRPAEMRNADRDQLLRDFSRLTDAQWRSKHETEHGLFVAEGLKVIQRALSLGYRLSSILTEEKWLKHFADTEDLPITVLPAKEIEEIAGYQVHRGALAAFERPDPVPLAELVTMDRLLLVEAVVDHENIGGIFRNAAALGANAVLLTAGCADPLYRRAIKVSMGGSLAIPFCHLPTTDEAVEALLDAGHELVALTPAGETLLSNWHPLSARVTLMLGAEGPGLSDLALAAAHARLSIPMDRDTDSLNVATAAALALWRLRDWGIVPE